MSNTSRVTGCLDSAGFRNTTDRGLTLFRKHRISPYSIISPVSSEGGTNWISTVTISLWACSPKNLQCSAFAVACQQPRTTACQQRRVAFCTVLFLSSDRLTADHRLSATCETDLHVPTRRKFVSVCDLFLFTCLHNAFMHVDMYT